MDNRTDKIIRKRKLIKEDGLCDVCFEKTCPDSKNHKPKRNNGQKPKYKDKK